MSLTAAISAATGMGSSQQISSNQTVADEEARVHVSTAAATVVASYESEKVKEETGYYGDSNDKLSVSARKFLSELPDLSYVL
jgi:hypothetical protein